MQIETVVRLLYVHLVFNLMKILPGNKKNEETNSYVLRFTRFV